MVGWWNTLVGDLYEQVTLWEYDDMAAFEHAIQTLSKDPAFARFVAARDPLLAGEESRFLRLARAPYLHPARSPPVRRARGPPRPSAPGRLPRVHDRPGPRPAQGPRLPPRGPLGGRGGPMDRGHVPFRFDSLAERERLDRPVLRDRRGPRLCREGRRVRRGGHDAAPDPVHVREAGTVKPAPTAGVLPHREELAPGVYAAGFSGKQHSANCGWVAPAEENLLIDVPRGIPVPEYLAMVAEPPASPRDAGGDPGPRRRRGDRAGPPRQGGRSRGGLTGDSRVGWGAPGGLGPALAGALDRAHPIGDTSVVVEFRPMDGMAGEAGAVVYLPGRSVLFGGPLVVHGPRVPLPGSDTERWVEALRRLEALAPSRVVPGSGSWGGPDVLARHRRFLAELRRQVGYVIAQGRPPAALREQVRLPAEFFAWMPYDTPTAADLDHVYRELTVPVAPFHGPGPVASDPRPHALVLIGDQPHEPGHIEEGLRPVFDSNGVVPHFTVDVKALSAENLARVRLLVILRDGLQRPGADHRDDFVWMTPEQEHAVARSWSGEGGSSTCTTRWGCIRPAGPISTWSGAGTRAMARWNGSGWRSSTPTIRSPAAPAGSSSRTSSTRPSMTEAACISC